MRIYETAALLAAFLSSTAVFAQATPAQPAGLTATAAQTPPACDASNTAQVLAFSTAQVQARLDTSYCNGTPKPAADEMNTVRAGMVEDCNRRVVDRCLSDPHAGFAAENRDVSFPCGPGFPTYGQHVSYRLRRLPPGSAQRVQIDLHLRFDVRTPSTDPARKSHMVERMRQCLPFIRGVWNRYGIDFNLRMDAAEAPLREAPDQTVVLSDYLGATPGQPGSEGRRSDAGHLFFHGIANGQSEASGEGCRNEMAQSDPTLSLERRTAECESTSVMETCRTLLHESGHMLGLPDEYPEIGPDGVNHCPGRNTIHNDVEPASVMRSPHGETDWHHIDFFPRHLQSILAPLCSGR